MYFRIVLKLFDFNLMQSHVVYMCMCICIYVYIYRYICVYVYICVLFVDARVPHVPRGSKGRRSASKVIVEVSAYPHMYIIYGIAFVAPTRHISL